MRARVCTILMAGLAMPAAALAGGTEAVTMRHQLNANPDDAAMMAKLARHYVQAGQPRKAERLYRGLLALDNVALERSGGPAVSSHWLAAQALRSLSRPRAVQLAGAR